MPPLVGITAIPRTVRSIVGEYPGHTIDERLVQAVIRAGGVPLVLPRAHAEHAAQQAEALDGLVLAGGQDVGAELYDGTTHERSTWLDAERDRWELTLLQAARDRGLPVLAVCRGVQLLNVAHGGTLHGHIEDELGHDYDAAAPRHSVTAEPGSCVARLSGTAFEVTTAHHQGLDRIGNGLKVVGHSPDGVIEALEHADRWLIAVQWHPEDTAATDHHQQSLYDALVTQARASRAAV
jgi:putative glutamine amidotransferase